MSGSVPAYDVGLTPRGLGLRAIENSEPGTMNQHQEPWNPEQGTTRV